MEASQWLKSSVQFLSGRQEGKLLQCRAGTEVCHVKMCSLSHYMSTKIKQLWKIQYGFKYFQISNILECFHPHVCQMRKNSICCSHVPAHVLTHNASLHRREGVPGWSDLWRGCLSRRLNNTGLGVGLTSELATGNA